VTQNINNNADGISLEDSNSLSRIVAKEIRTHALRMVHQANASHIGSCLSMADLLSVLYCNILKINPQSPGDNDRDRFFLSKGHGAAILYALLAERGFFPIKDLDNYCKDGSMLTGHINSEVPGAEFSTGSLGHGLPVACGVALAGQAGHNPYRVFVMLSDGELDEGSNWEAILFAPHHKLDNLVAIVDYNKLQGFGATPDVLDLEPLDKKWQTFGWSVRVIDGHNHSEINAAFKAVPFEKGKPSVIIANTVKGKGVGFMENQLAWHYKSPNDAQLEQARAELGDLA
jgi:transketolase